MRHVVVVARRIIGQIDPFANSWENVWIIPVVQKHRMTEKED